MDSSVSICPDFSAVLLAGGRSLRMGRDKALLPHPVTGLPLIVNQANTLLEAGCAELFLSVREGRDYDLPGPEVPRILDDGSGGPLPVIERALGIVSRPVLFLLAVDMPFVTPDLVRSLVARSSSNQGVLVRFAHGPEPLCTVYAKSSRSFFQRSLLNQAFALQPLLAAGIKEGWMLAVDDADPRAFANWNSPADLSPIQPAAPS